MNLRKPSIEELTAKYSKADSVLVAAPFYSREGLEWVKPIDGGRVEFWTRLNPNDWASGVADPPALVNYLRAIGEDRVTLRVHRALHAKIYQVDGSWSWIGSPNLTRAAFTRNIELVAQLDESENRELEGLISSFRESLRLLTLEVLEDFVDVTQDAIQKIDRNPPLSNEDFEAAVELADEVLAPHSNLEIRRNLLTLDEFMEVIVGLKGSVPETIRDHYTNQSGQNRQGHVKQSYYALRLFLTLPRVKFDR